MNRKTGLAIALAWILSLVGVAAWAQSSGQPRPLGEIITGENIGFQRFPPEMTRDGKVIGKWMVRIDGKWVETQSVVGIVR